MVNEFAWNEKVIYILNVKGRGKKIQDSAEKR
jgi:hypothetical protein